MNGLSRILRASLKMEGDGGGPPRAKLCLLQKNDETVSEIEKLIIAPGSNQNQCDING